MTPKFRLSKSFYGSSQKLPTTPDFSQPTLVADGNDDEAYETPYDAAIKRQSFNDARVPQELTSEVPTEVPSDVPPTMVIEQDQSKHKHSLLKSDSTPPASPQGAVKFGRLDYLNSDSNSVLRHDMNSHLEDEHTPLPSPKKNANSLLYQKHRRNQSSVSLLKTYSNVPDYQIGEYKEASPLRVKPSYHVKIVVVGDGGCGKTCLLVCYAQGQFPTVYVPTIFENYVAHVKTPNNETVELALWDTAGQEEYDRLRPLSYPDADIFLICYSMDSPVSLNNVKQSWYPEVEHFCPGVPLILVGLKSDLYRDDSISVRIDRKITKQVARDINAVAHIECSAKTMFNVKTVFNLALDTVLKKLKAKNDKRSSVLMTKLSKPSRISMNLSPKKDPPTFEYGAGDYYQENPEAEQVAPTSNSNSKSKSNLEKSKKKKKHRCIVL